MSLCRDRAHFAALAARPLPPFRQMIENFILNNGIKIPALGLGTWFIEDENAVQTVREAVKIGYRHFDTAQAYENECGVGEGISTCGVNRSDLFVTTKLAAEIKDYKQANPEQMRNNIDLNFLISEDDVSALKNLTHKNYGEFGLFPVFSGK